MAGVVVKIDGAIGLGHVKSGRKDRLDRRHAFSINANIDEYQEIKTSVKSINAPRWLGR